MHAARLSGCEGARWGRGGVTAAKGRWSWAVRWVKVTVGQQVLLENKRGGAAQCCCASSSLWRQPTAVMRAAPLPLPSSDSRKLTSHFGASSFTVCWKIREKLRVKSNRKLWLGGSSLLNSRKWDMLSRTSIKYRYHSSLTATMNRRVEQGKFM